MRKFIRNIRPTLNKNYTPRGDLIRHVEVLRWEQQLSLHDEQQLFVIGKSGSKIESAEALEQQIQETSNAKSNHSRSKSVLVSNTYGISPRRQKWHA